MSDTPRTDALKAKQDAEEDSCGADFLTRGMALRHYWTAIDHARTLERELAEAKGCVPDLVYQRNKELLRQNATLRDALQWVRSDIGNYAEITPSTMDLIDRALGDKP